LNPAENLEAGLGTGPSGREILQTCSFGALLPKWKRCTQHAAPDTETAPPILHRN